MSVTFSSLEQKGRLGNQLFQIATTIAFSKFLHKEAIFPKWKYDYYLNNHLKINNIHSDITYEEPCFEYTNFFENYKNKEYNCIDINGYFQSEKYFKKYREDILKQFTLRRIFSDDLKERYFNILNLPNICSIHVRRGDYLNQIDKHPPQTLEYYFKAINIMKEKYQNISFVVFSDDINWCKQNFAKIEDNMYYPDPANNEILDLFLMSYCKHHIIANSSFSWWGAWLNTYTDKTIIAPKIWFGPNLPLKTNDLYCEGWMII